MERVASGTAYGVSDRGECPVCGQSVVLRLMTGMLRSHGDDCPGGGKPPARTKETVTLDLPEP